MLITTRCQHNDIEVAKWPRSSHVRDIRVCCHVAMPNDSRYTTRLVRSSSVNQIPSYRTSTAPRNVNDMTHVLFPHTKHRPSVRTTHAITTCLSRQGWGGGGGRGGEVSHTPRYSFPFAKKKRHSARAAPATAFPTYMLPTIMTKDGRAAAERPRSSWSLHSVG